MLSPFAAVDVGEGETMLVNIRNGSFETCKPSLKRYTTLNYDNGIGALDHQHGLMRVQ
jgi:hypothetical protein